MKLPDMKYTDQIQRVTQTKFGGYNHQKGAGDGELYDMKNLTSLYYPLLASRPVRYLLTTLTKPNGLYGRDKLCWVDGTTYYYDGVSRGAVADSAKTFVAIGYYILIFPDKKYFNTRALGTYADLAALGTGVPAPGLNDCYAVGAAAPYALYYWDGSAWTYLMAEFGSLESTYTGGATFQDGYLYGEAAEKNTIYNASVTWSNYFKAGDAVTISGCTSYPDNNKTPVIREIDDTAHTMSFYENIFDNGSETNVTISRWVPNMDFLCENENRLWGCKGDTIYASKLGDPFNWNVFDGLSTDSYSVDVGSAGDFSGCVSHLGYPVFFKQGNIYKVYGSIPSNYQVMGSATLGCQEDSGASFAVAGEILFYLSRAGIMAYSGGIPSSVAEVFGTERYKNAVAGSDGLKYYVSMEDSAEAWHLFVYDTVRGLWHREDNVQALYMAYAHDDNNLYLLDSAGKIWAIGNVADPPESATVETSIEWFAEFGDFTEGDANKKGVSKFQIRAELDTAATLTVQIKFDGAATWTTIKSLTAASKKSYNISVIPQRADHYRLRLSGTGGCRIYSMSRSFYSGSEI